MIATTPEPPYYAVIFSTIKSDQTEGYAEMAESMYTLAAQQPGFLGVESARGSLGITISYWQDRESIKQWKQHADHVMAQKLGRTRWYYQYKTRICLVEADYGFNFE